LVDGWTDGSGNISWRGSARLSPEIVAHVQETPVRPHQTYLSPTILHSRESGILSVIFQDACYPVHCRACAPPMPSCKWCCYAILSSGLNPKLPQLISKLEFNLLTNWITRHEHMLRAPALMRRSQSSTERRDLMYATPNCVNFASLHLQCL
jgi:hypothetical protein